jgi:hypothetical protein
MKRIIGYIVVALSVTCLLLIPATGLLWWRAQRVSDWLRFRRPDVMNRAWSSADIFTTRGGLFMYHLSLHFDTVEGAQGYAAYHQATQVPLHATIEAQSAAGLSKDWWERLGFAFKATLARGTGFEQIQRNVEIPYWFVMVLLLAGGLPALWRGRRAYTRRRRVRLGLCRACGYDLRATPGRCPECGAEAVTGGAR